MLIGVALQGGAQNSKQTFRLTELPMKELTCSAGMFIAARGLLGFGLAFNITAAPLLILEVAYPSQRVRAYFDTT